MSPRDWRLTMLLSFGGWGGEPWVDQLPRLLEPIGIRSIRVETGEQATQAIEQYQIHIAVVDLRIPLSIESERRTPAGPRVLQLLRRLNQPPPTVVVRGAQPIERERTRGLSEALREGAFAVLDHPVRVETMLEVMRRIVRRHYADLWPTN